VSEIAQAFCRLCAVFGGVYLLRRSVTALHLDPSSGALAAVSLGKTRLACSTIVMSQQYTVESLAGANLAPPRAWARATILVTAPVLPGGPAENIAGLLAVPAHTAGNPAPVQVMVLGSPVSACPEGFCSLVFMPFSFFEVRYAR
jgi:RAB protein geranylgeranyltransferase component A